jgi:hypothetical protein
LLAALESAFPVRFAAAPSADADAALVLRGVDPPADDLLLAREVPTLEIGGSSQRLSQPEKVTFGEARHVDRRVRGIEALDRLDGPELGPLGDDQEVLASSRSGPAWTRSSGPIAVHRVRCSLPELGPEQALRDLLVERSLALVALVHFLRAVTAEHRFDPPPIRATILFDDPNLRWRTYGFIDYRELLAHADAHDYHAAMAMIPLDGRRQHRATVDLFRSRPDRLSLVLHGNNHIARELMRPQSEADAIALSAQAMRRAERFEARYGLPMDRVMTPPHGLCSPSVARALGALGFDALCAIHPLPWTDRIPPDRPLAGWDPADFAAGCAVIPRMHISTPFDQVALRAFLDQPLVLYGHHDDLADGLDLLAQTAARVNGLGGVRWASLSEIAGSNYASRLDDSVLRVRPYAHRMRLKLPEGAKSLLVERPRCPEDSLAGWSVGDSMSQPFDAPCACAAGDREIRLRTRAGLDPAAVPDPAPSLWPILRRAATETRDRLQPLLATAGST